MRRFLRCFLLMLLTLAGAGAGSVAAATNLPDEVNTKQPASFELLRDGKPAGRLELSAGQTLAVVDVQDRYVIARYRNLNGRVLISDTTLPAEFIPRPVSAPVAAAAATKGSSLPAKPAESSAASRVVSHATPTVP